MIDVVVFAAPGRDEAHRRCFASIEASDIGRNYTVKMHPDGMDKNEHWRQTHLCAAQARIVIAGSPWPFEVLHQFTSSSRSTALLVRGVKDEWVPYTLGDGSIAGQAKSKVS